MARNVSLAKIRARVRRRAGIQGEVTSFPDADLNDEINESLANLYDVIRKAFGSDFFRSSSTFTATSGIDTYSLPADLLTLVSVDAVVSGGLKLTVRRFMEAERNLYNAFPWVVPVLPGVYAPGIMYKLIGSNIRFIPIPTSNITFTLNYVQTAPSLVNDTDTFDGVNGWEEFVALDAAIRILLQDGESDLIARLENRLQQVTQRVIDLARERDSGEPDRAQEVDGAYNDA